MTKIIRSGSAYTGRALATVGLCVSVFAACTSGGGNDGNTSGLSGTVRVDGSSTVFPISEAIAEEFLGEHPEVRVTVGVSGTGGGFKKFCGGEIDISDASRPIKATEQDCVEEKGVDYVELPVAYDGIAVVANPKNAFVTDLTVEELRRIWSSDGGVTTWADVREGLPDEEIVLYGPGTDSGTFDYFVEAVLGKGGKVRPDFTASEDDNVLVQGVAGDPNGLGFFGFAYYAENSSRLKLVGIDGGNGVIKPSEKTINNGTYAPLSRPIFVYVSVEAAQREEVDVFVRFYLDNVASIASEVGYVPLPEPVYGLARTRYSARQAGTIYGEGKHGDLAALMKEG